MAEMSRGRAPPLPARILAPVIGMNTMELGAKLAGGNSYIVLKRDVAPATKRAIDKLHLSGVIGSTLTVKRTYSGDTVAGSLLGGVNSENNGVAGIESMEQSSLAGQDGQQVYEHGGNGTADTRYGNSDRAGQKWRYGKAHH